MNLIDFILSNKRLYNTDKFELGYVKEFYNDLFTDKRTEIKNVLEIGIHQGNSILLWRDFFPSADIYGMDINVCPDLVGKDRITQIITDAYKRQSLENFANIKFDVIIDDGPHTFESMKFFLENYLTLLNEDGVAVLEDIVDPKWTSELIKLIDSKFEVTVIHMAGKQLTASLLRDWSKGLDVIVIKYGKKATN